MNLCSEKDIKQLLSRHGFHFSKSMGQNFLIENWVPADLVDGAGVSKENGVLEIGPGIGPLTVELADAAAKVVSVELDKSLLPILGETLSEHDNVEIVPGDILKVNIPALVDEKFAGLTPMACANLPYNITSPVLTALIEANRFSCITVMIQREVARRICAAPGTSDYGSFSIYCQYHTKTELLFDVGPECFLPPPKVTSAVIRLTPQAKPECVTDERRFFRLVKAGFAQRRKTLLNALSAGIPTRDKDAIRTAILNCGLDENIRGERLGIPEFAALAKELGDF